MSDRKAPTREFCNDDGDGNENVKKAIGLSSKTSSFTYIAVEVLATVAVVDAKIPCCRILLGELNNGGHTLKKIT